MSARIALIWGNAAWREAVRLREPYVDVDHLLLGLMAAGGPAARLLGDHGFTLGRGRRAVAAARAGALASLGVDLTSLPSPAALSVEDLHRGEAGHAPMTPQAKRLCKDLPGRPSERDYLAALLAEPSGMVREVLRCADADVNVLQQGLADSAIGWGTPTPRRVVPSWPAARGQRVDALHLEHWVSAPDHRVHQVATDPTLITHWLKAPDDRLEVRYRRSEPPADTTSSPGAAGLLLGLATPTRVRWEMWWGSRYGGSDTLDLEPTKHGTLVGLTREIVTFGRFATAVMPAVRLMTGLGMPTMIQNLSFACADLIEDQLP